MLCWEHALSSANSSVSERQSLLGLDDNSYYVIAIKSEVKISHYESYLRVALKQYELNSNRLLADTTLSETQISTDVDSFEQSVKKTMAAEDNLDNLLSKNVIRYSGYGKHPSKKFVFDKNGVFINSNGSRDYVLSLEELTQRIPDYEQRLEYDFTAPAVVEVYSESTPTGLRYLVAVRSGTWRSDLSSFEYIISLPEN